MEGESASSWDFPSLLHNGHIAPPFFPSYGDCRASVGSGLFLALSGAGSASPIASIVAHRDAAHVECFLLGRFFGPRGEEPPVTLVCPNVTERAIFMVRSGTLPSR